MMKQSSSFIWSRRVSAMLALGALVVAVSLFFVTRQANSGSPGPAILIGAMTVGQQAIPPERVVGRDQCKKCHESEYAASRESAHAEDAWELLDGSKAKDFATKLGIPTSEIKTTSMCVACHGTPRNENGKLVVDEGNSCESCHGGAGGDNGWLAIHTDFGSGSDKTMAELLKERPNETAGHRTERLKSCKEAGMNRSEDVVEIAHNCLQCHLVPNEKLVNAGHPTSAKFEYVAWSQGEVRHNFLLDETANAEVPSLWLAQGNGRNADGRKRLMLVVGYLAKLEVNLRARSIATDDSGDFFEACNEGITKTMKELNKIKKDDVDDLASVLKIADQYKLDDDDTLEELKDGDKANYTEAADAIKNATSEFIETHRNGDKLPELKIKRAKGKPYKG